MSKTFSPGGNNGADNPQALHAMLEEDIPSVFATVETPVVSAAPTPYVVQAVPEIASGLTATYPTPSAPPVEQSPSNKGEQNFI